MAQNEASATQLIHVYVAGPMFDDRPTTIRQLRLGDPLWLVRQTDNAVDVHAIRLQTKSQALVGFIPRQMAAWLAPFIDANKSALVAEVSELHHDVVTGTLRVQVAFRVPDVWTELAAPGQIASPGTIEYTVETNELGMYVLATCDAERLVMLRDILQANDLPVVRTGYSTWQAKNGRLYEWYLKLGSNTGKTIDDLQKLLRSRLKGMARDTTPATLDGVTQEMRAEVARLQKEHAKALQDANTAVVLGSETEQEKQAQVEELQRNIDRLKLQIAELERKRVNAEQKADATGIALSIRESRAVAMAPETYDILQDSISASLSPKQILQLVTALAPDHVVLLDSAIKSAEKAIGFQQPERLFELLWKLIYDYRLLMIAGKSHADVVALFGAPYAAHESESTENSAACRRARTFVYNGQPVVMMKHLKIGVGMASQECLRLHFEWDTKNQKVVIGHCGAHLPTAS